MPRISVAGRELGVWFVYGVWRGDPHPSDLLAAPGIPLPCRCLYLAPDRNVAVTLPPFPFFFFHFSLISGGDDDMDFDIEKSTGSMVIARALDARKKSSYNLTVEVTDGSTTIKTQVILSALVETHREWVYAKGNLPSDSTDQVPGTRISLHHDLSLHSDTSLAQVPD